MEISSRSDTRLEVSALAEIKDKVKISLDETRILVLGVQVLLGFDYSGALSQGFDKLPEISQYAKLASHCLLIFGFGLLISPASQHQIVNEGKSTPAFLEFVTRVAGAALLPIALALGIDVYVPSERITGQLPAALIGALISVLALFFWYGIEVMYRSRSGKNTAAAAAQSKQRQEKQSMSDDQKQQSDDSDSVKDRVNHVLTETRVVLPGAQALLGFQLAGVLMESFEKLPESSKYIHLASMFAVAIATILLMTPAAYHRIAEQGRETEHFHRIAGRLLLAAMAVLAAGISGDFYVVVAKTLQSSTAAIVFAGLTLLFFYGLWFGFTFAQKQSRQQATPSSIPFAKQKEQSD